VIPEPARQQDFPSVPASASQARRFTVEACGAWSLDRAHIDALVLVVSELATNAILHAVTPFTVTIAPDDGDGEGDGAGRGGGVRVEVIDGSSAMPVVRHYGTDATTGRGLALVSASSRQWGVTARSDGKVIWAVVPPPSEHHPGAGDGAPEVDDLRLAARKRPDARRVKFLGVPVQVYLALQAHNDEIFRDLELIRIEAELVGDAEEVVPPSVMEVIRPLTTAFGRPRDNLRERVELAYTTGLTRVDLENDFPASATQSALDYVTLLERVDELCRKGHILSPPASREVAALRRWFAEEVDRQLTQGRPPTPAPS
jgi:hypothetical protein